MGLGQYNSLGEYCGPHTASSVFLTLIPVIVEATHDVVVEYHVFVELFYTALTTLLFASHSNDDTPSKGINTYPYSSQCPKGSGGGVHLSNKRSRMFGLNVVTLPTWLQASIEPKSVFIFKYQVNLPKGL